MAYRPLSRKVSYLTVTFPLEKCRKMAVYPSPPMRFNTLQRATDDIHLQMIVRKYRNSQLITTDANLEYGPLALLELTEK